MTRGTRLVMATIALTLLALLTALANGIELAAIYGWLVVLPVLLPVGMATAAAVMGVVNRWVR